MGVCGGSCSGKTTFAKRAFEVYGADNCQILFQDNYYYDQSIQFQLDQCRSVNFDHPDAIDFELLAEHLKMLKQGESVHVPLYDFKSHSRTGKSILFSPKPVIFLDGILILTQPQVRDLLDDSVYIECDEDVRFKRRMARDTVERGRTVESVQEQFYGQVNPMHKVFVEPSKIYAHRVIPQQQYIDHCDQLIKGLELEFI
ncbi:MAG: uridine kinase [Bdellovibrionales bacterium]